MADFFSPFFFDNYKKAKFIGLEKNAYILYRRALILLKTTWEYIVSIYETKQKYSLK
jgi:hypothetical protein